MSNYQTKRVTVPEAEEILGKEFKVLDKGFVRLVDYMGGDDSIVQAARVSYGEGTKKVSEDKGLIRYLMRHRHTTPFEMVELKFHVKVPMDCWRQWIRHRTANVNEYSTRYSIAIIDSQKTESGEWRMQSKNNKQGSSGFLEKTIGEGLTNEENTLQEFTRKVYENRLEKGVAREQARKDLPLSTYTEAYWKIDLHNLFHFLGLRMEENAQWEIRQYANTLANITKAVVPISYQAFEDYILNSTKISSSESKVIGEIIKRANISEDELNEISLSLPTKREATEFKDKIKKYLNQ